MSKCDSVRHVEARIFWVNKSIYDKNYHNYIYIYIFDTFLPKYIVLIPVFINVDGGCYNVGYGYCDDLVHTNLSNSTFWHQC